MADKIMDFLVPAEGDNEVIRQFYAYDTVSFYGSVKDSSKTSFAFPNASWKVASVILFDEHK